MGRIVGIGFAKKTSFYGATVTIKLIVSLKVYLNTYELLFNFTKKLHWNSFEAYENRFVYFILHSIHFVWLSHVSKPDF